MESLAGSDNGPHTSALLGDALSKGSASSSSSRPPLVQVTRRGSASAASSTAMQAARGASGAGCAARRCCSVHQVDSACQASRTSQEDSGPVFRGARCCLGWAGNMAQVRSGASDAGCTVRCRCSVHCVDPVDQACARADRESASEAACRLPWSQCLHCLMLFAVPYRDKGGTNCTGQILMLC